MKTHLKQVQHFSGEENSKFKQNPYTVYIPKGKNITEESTGVFAVPSVCRHSKHHHSHHHLSMGPLCSWNTSLESRPVAKWNKKSTQRH